MGTQKYIWDWNPEWYDFIHGNKVNKLAECNLLHDILNLHKRTKLLNSHYSPILQGCMNICKGKAKFKNLQIILDSEWSSKLLIGRPIQKNIFKKWRCDAMAHTIG